jgi:hypothetical protein
MASRRYSFTEGGPPEPISLLRGGSTNSQGDIVTEANVEHSPPNKKQRRHQEPPARERPTEGQPWPYRDSLSFTRSLIFYGTGSVTAEHVQACKSIQACRAVRQKYCGQQGTLVQEELLVESSNTLSLRMGNNGVMELLHKSSPDVNICVVPSIDDYNHDYGKLVEMISEGAMRSFSFQRLQLLSTAFKVGRMGI